MAHEHVKGLDDLKDKTILVATPGRTSWWPWMRRKYGYTDAQTQAYTFNLQPFFNDKNIVQQSYPSSEPFQAMQKGMPVKFFLMADNGYPPYGTTMVTTTKFVAEKPDVARRFVRASIEGWKSYLKGDPSPANALIKADNPKMSDEQIAFGIKRLNELEVADGGDAKTMGMGIITEARWKATYELMVQEGLLPADTDWKKGFTTTVREGPEDHLTLTRRGDHANGERRNDLGKSEEDCRHCSSARRRRAGDRRLGGVLPRLRHSLLPVPRAEPDRHDLRVGRAGADASAVGDAARHADRAGAGGGDRLRGRVPVRAEPDHRAQLLSLRHHHAGDADRRDRAADHHPGQEHAAAR